MTPGQRSVAIMHAAIKALEQYAGRFYGSVAALDALAAIYALQADCPHTHAITHGFDGKRYTQLVCVACGKLI